MVRGIRTNRIGQRLGTVLYSGLPVSFYNIRFPLLYPYHPAASLLQAASRILCNTLHKPCEAPCSKRTDTDRLEVTEGDMYITRRSFKTVRWKVRPGCPLPCFIRTLPLFYLLPLIAFSCPCDLSWTYFPAKVIGCSNPANAGILPRVSCKNLPLRCRAYFSASALSDCLRHLPEAEK